MFSVSLLGERNIALLALSAICKLYCCSKKFWSTLIGVTGPSMPIAIIFWESNVLKSGDLNTLLDSLGTRILVRVECALLRMSRPLWWLAGRTPKLGAGDEIPSI